MLFPAEARHVLDSTGNVPDTVDRQIGLVQRLLRSEGISAMRQTRIGHFFGKKTRKLVTSPYSLYPPYKHIGHLHGLYARTGDLLYSQVLVPRKQESKVRSNVVFRERERVTDVPRET